MKYLVVRHYIATEQNTETRYYIETQEEHDYSRLHTDFGCNTLTIMCECDSELKAYTIQQALMLQHEINQQIA
jgi:hypothetical protein